jgi:hypothetical protein
VRVVVRRLCEVIWDGESPAIPRVGERISVNCGVGSLFVDRVTWHLQSIGGPIAFVDVEPLSMYGDGAPLHDERKAKAKPEQPTTGRKRR